MAYQSSQLHPITAAACERHIVMPPGGPPYPRAGRDRPPFSTSLRRAVGQRHQHDFRSAGSGLRPLEARGGSNDLNAAPLQNASALRSVGLPIARVFRFGGGKKAKLFRLALPNASCHP